VSSSSHLVRVRVRVRVRARVRVRVRVRVRAWSQEASQLLVAPRQRVAARRAAPLLQGLGRVTVRVRVLGLGLGLG